MAEKSSKKSIQILAAFAANLLQLTYGFSYSLSSFAVPEMLKGEGGMKYSEVETSWFASIMALGSITGALHGGFFAEKIGRKRSLLMDAFGMTISYLIIGLSDYFPLILVGRYLSGHFAGSSMVATSMFVSETSHPSIRGFTGTLFVIEYGTGFSLCMFLGAIFPWKTVVCIATSFPALGFIIMLLLKESPSWLLRKNREAEAVESLFFYRGNALVVSDEIGRMKESARRAEKDESINPKVMNNLTYKLRRLTDMSFLRPFFLLNLMRIGIEWGGFPALAFYMHTILANLNIPFNPYWIAVILAAFRSVICIMLSFILIKTPRRAMYLTSGGLVVISLFGQAAYAWSNPYVPEHLMVYTKWIPLICIFIQYLGYGLGWGAITYMLQGEVLPSDMRSFGGGLIGIMGNFYLFLAVKTVPTLMASVGVGGTFSIYCGLSLMVLFICFFTMPETKGMSLEDIEDYYSADNSRHKQNKNNDKKILDAI